jgi:thioredoxin 1
MTDARPRTVALLLLEFYASWCVHCEQQRAVLAEVFEISGTAVEWRRVDAEAVPEDARRYGVTSIPALVLLNEGREIRRLVGLQPRRNLERLLALPL